MKQLLTILFSLILITAFTFPAQSQDNSDAGKVGLIFVLNGLNDLGVGAYNGGIGAKFYLTNHMALRGSLGASYTKYDETEIVEDTKVVTTKEKSNFFLTTGLLFELFKTKNTAGYVGPEISLNRVESVNTLGFGGVVGAEFFVVDGVSLGAEYKISFDNKAGYWNVAFPQTGGNFLLNIYF
jgi:opacity protein-like surface antigen